MSLQVYGGQLLLGHTPVTCVHNWHDFKSSALKFPLLETLKGPSWLRGVFSTCSSEHSLLQNIVWVTGLLSCLDKSKSDEARACLNHNWKTPEGHALWAETLLLLQVNYDIVAAPLERAATGQSHMGEPVDAGRGTHRHSLLLQLHFPCGLLRIVLILVHAVTQLNILRIHHSRCWSPCRGKCSWCMHCSSS